MKKIITLIFLTSLSLVSCKKETTEEVINTNNYPPVMLKVQAVDNDDIVITESNIINS